MRNRNRSFVIRLSDEEFQALEEKRKKSGYPREVFLRHLIADGTVREAPSVDYPKLLLALSRKQSQSAHCDRQYHSLH